jgi:myo-inositol-1(or 4)-monophosphatase
MDYRYLLQDILPVVEEAAAFIRSQAGKVKDEAVEIKARNSLVSYVDKGAEEILVKGLRSVLPNAGFITEEGTVAQERSEYTWIIDPLDGTTNFLQNIPFYSVSVGLVHHDELVIGIVIDVEQEETFYASKGGGAWCNGKSIFVSKRSSISDAVVATGFPYSAKNVTPQMLSVFDYFLKNARGIRRLGSAALDLAYVACGRFDVYYEGSLNAWDIAGGILLVKEAGGMVCDLKGEQNMMEVGQIISANALVFPEASQIIRNIFGS